MQTVTLRGVVDTYATEVYKKQKSPGSERLYLRTQSSRRVYAFGQYAGVPGGPSVTIAQAILRIPLAAPWEGNTTLTAARVTSSVPASELHWDKQPTVTTTGQATLAVSNGTTGVLEVDVTAIVQQWASGAANYGFRLSSTGTGLQRLHSAEAKVATELKPALVITYSSTPGAPTGLTPGQGLAVSLLRPTLQWQYRDIGSAQLGAFQIQVSNTASFDTPTFDSGTVTETAPTFTMPVDVGAEQWWRVRHRSVDSDWSDWSVAERFVRVAKTPVTIVEPTDGGTTSDSSPTIVWDFPGVQLGWRVLLRRDATVLLDTDDQGGDADSWSDSTPLDYAAGDVTAEVRVVDNVPRASTPGDPPWSVATVTFGYEPSDDVDPVTDLAVMQGAVMPTAVLTWKRTNTPDVFKVLRDGLPIATVVGADLGVPGSPGDFVFEDATAVPDVEHVYTVVATENGADSADSPSIEFTARTYYVWLIDPTRDDGGDLWWVALVNNDDLGLTFGETSEMLFSKGGDRGVLVVDALRGYEGPVAGGVFDGMPGVGGNGARWLQQRLHHTKKYPTRVFRLVAPDLNIPVLVREVTWIRKATPETAFSASMQVYQQGELPW